MAKKTSVGSALGFLTLISTGIMAGVKSKEDIDDIVSLPEATTKPLIDRFVQMLHVAAQTVKNIFSINVGDNRTTEQVVAAGNYQYANPWINDKNFPWRRRQGKKMIELVDMTQHGFQPTYTLNDALAVLQKLGLERPVYEDGLLFGEQYPEKQRERPIMFPHEAVLDADGYPSVVYLWSYSGDRKLYLFWADYGWYSDALVAGVRKS